MASSRITVIFRSKGLSLSCKNGLRSSIKPLGIAPLHTSSTRWQEENGKEAKKEEKSNETPGAKKEEVKVEEKKEEKVEISKEKQQEAKIAELTKQVEDLKGQILYVLADRENIRRIGQEDARKASLFGITSFAKDLMGVSDNLGRCIEALPKEPQSGPIHDVIVGLQMTDKELKKVFKAHGIEPFEPKVGDKFDPNSMNALMEIPDPNRESGTVGLVIKNGFFIKERVLRPADVGVVKSNKKASS